MPDYKKGQIYKICDVGFNKCYIGSTVEKLYVRMVRHRCHYKKYLEGQNHFLHLFKIFDEFGIENCKIYWIEDYPCGSKKELEAREGYYIQNTDCVNKRIEGRTKKQWEEENCEKVKSQRKEHWENNKERYNEERKTQFHCECGSVLRFHGRNRHFKTQKHQRFLEKICN